MRSEGQNGDSHHLLSLRGALEVETRGCGVAGPFPWPWEPGCSSTCTKRIQPNPAGMGGQWEVNRGWNEPRHQYEQARKRLASIDDANPPNEQNTCLAAMVSASVRPLNHIRSSSASGLCLLSGGSKDPALELLQDGRLGHSTAETAVQSGRRMLVAELSWVRSPIINFTVFFFCLGFFLCLCLAS